jgi:hypothetical protein
MPAVSSPRPIRRESLVALGLLAAAALFALLGLMMVLLFSIDTETTTSGALWWRKTETTSIPLSQRITYLTIGLVMLVVAATCVFAAMWLFNLHNRLKKYPPILVGVEVMSIQRIVEITNQSRGQVIRDIQRLIESDMISDFYMDNAADAVISKKYVPKISHKAVVTCYGCGATNELIVGIPKPCNHCQQPLLLGTA